MAKKKKRVVRYRAPININAGIVIFGIIFLYVAINVIIYFSKERVTYYEVVQGSVADDSDHSYTAIALRKEDVFYADNAGYINFYARESSRVSKNTTLYSIDESGRINELLSQMNDDEKTLSDENIGTVKEQLYTFVSNFDEMNYSTVYDFKSTLQGTVVELINMNALQSIYASLGDSKAGQFEIKKAGSSGIVEYTIDNYEDLTVKKLKASDFNKKNYISASIESGDIVETGAPIYKTLSQEEWRLAIQLSDEDVEKYADTTAVKIRFKKDNTTVTTNFEIQKGSDNGNYGILTFQKYLIRYASDRFLDIEIIEDSVTGLKVPKTSVINKEFYVIPKEYQTTGQHGKTGFMKRVYEKSEVKDVFCPLTIHSEDEYYYYIDKSDLEAGDEIILTGSGNSGESETKKDGKKKEISDTYVIKEMQSLTGVYNINNGYTKFVVVSIMEETGDYYIIESENKYSLMVYDHIILNGSMVKENQVIFQ